jgi:hypothetical protein
LPSVNGCYMAIEEMLVELKSLGISPNRTNEMNNKQELSNLIENIKQGYLKEYRIVYHEE